MIIGCDISHYQGSNFDMSAQDFIIAKASEGRTFVDKQFNANMEKALNLGKLIGAYHFARPENNSALVEAKNFVAVVEPYIGKCMLCLDWEMEAWNHPIEWALDWMTSVYVLTGVKPVLYANESRLAKCEPIAKAGFGLWVAKWGKNTGEPSATLPNPSPFKMFALWQYTSKPFDKDYFNGTKEQFAKYCLSEKTQPPIVTEPVEDDGEVTEDEANAMGMELYKLLTENGWSKDE